MDCGCKWDGNLDGRLRRCKDHQEAILLERRVQKDAWKNYQTATRLHAVLEEVRSHSRAVRYVVEFAENKHP